MKTTVKKNVAFKAKDIALRILKKLEKSGVNPTDFKLQTLLYYSQGYYLAKKGEKLFEDSVEAWMYGPVVPSVFDIRIEYLDSYGRKKPKGDWISDEMELLLDSVVEEKGKQPDEVLRDEILLESPYTETPKGKEISIKKLKKFFIEKINPVPELVSVNNPESLLSGLFALKSSGF